MTGGWLKRLGLAFSVLMLISPALLFFIWMLSLSLKFEIDNSASPPILIPTNVAWSNYVEVFNSNRFLLYFRNSLIVTGAATLIALLVGVPAGWAIARLDARKTAIVIMIARMTPGLSFLIPMFLLFQWLGLLGTLVPQIVIHLVLTIPLVVWIMISYFETTPRELEEAAVVDGATRWQTFHMVALPIAKPGIVVAAILAVIFSWNNFVFGIVLSGRETRTLPVLLLTVIAQRQIVAGLTAGAVKGG